MKSNSALFLLYMMLVIPSLPFIVAIGMWTGLNDGHNIKFVVHGAPLNQLVSNIGNIGKA